jgi:hypothetical protein
VADSEQCRREGGSKGKKESKKNKKNKKNKKDEDDGGTYLSEAAAEFCPRWSDKPTDDKLEDMALEYRNLFQDAGYDLHTVFYNESASSRQADFMRAMTAGNGVYLESPDPDDLGEMLQSVCRAYVRQHAGLVF